MGEELVENILTLIQMCIIHERLCMQNSLFHDGYLFTTRQQPHIIPYAGWHSQTFKSSEKYFLMGRKGINCVLFSFPCRNLRVVIRFIGVTGDSRRVRLILFSLCYQISEIYKVPVNLSQVATHILFLCKLWNDLLLHFSHILLPKINDVILSRPSETCP